MNKILTCPYVRGKVLKFLTFLLDEEFRKTWFGTTAKHRFWDSLDFYIFDYLLNSSDILDADWNTERAIGKSLYNTEEADLIKNYLKFYNGTFEGEMPDDYYVNHPQWTYLLEETKRIIELMEKNNEKYNFEQEMDLFYQEEEDKRIAEVCERIDSVESFSLEKKEQLKRRMLDSKGIDELFDIHNTVLNEVNEAKGISKNK